MRYLPVLFLHAAMLPVPAVAAAAATNAAGSGAADPMETIVVVAHKSERSLRQVAASVTVVSADEIAANVATSMAQVLESLPGIDAEGAGTRFGSEGISLRGIGGNRVALLLDGVPLGDQFAVGSFSNATRDFVNAGFVERAEILHGPASALYGSAAIGGVVALRTTEPADLRDASGPGGRVGAAWQGADASRHATALAAFGDRDSGWLVGAGLRSGREPDPAGLANNPDRRDFERRSALFKYRRDTARGHTLGLAGYLQEVEVDSELHSMLGSGRFRSTTALEGDDRHRLQLFAAHYGFGAEGGRIDSGLLRAWAGVTDVEQQTLDERGLATRPVRIDRLFDFRQEFRGAEINLQKRVAGAGAEHRLAAGLELRERRTREFRDGLETGIEDGLATDNLLGEVFPLRDFPISTTTDLGLYVEDAVSAGDWTVIAALRADHYRMRPETDPMYAEDYPFAAPVALSESDLSPKLGLIYRASRAVDLYLQYAHGFRAPPYEDANIGLELPAFNIRAVPNPDLRSERSEGYEAGIRYAGGRVTARLALFHTDYEDFIDSRVRLGPDPESGRILFQSQNLQSARISGVEAAASLVIPVAYGALSAEATAYLANGRNRDSGAPLNSVGPPQAVVDFAWSAPGGAWRTSLRATLTGRWDERDESAGALFETPGHAVLDLVLTRRVSDRLSVRAGVRNLADRRYWHWADVRGLAPDDPVIPTLARPGRSGVLSLEMNW